MLYVLQKGRCKIFIHIKKKRKDGKYNVKLNFDAKQLGCILTPAQCIDWIDKAENKESYNWFSIDNNAKGVFKIK